MARVTPSSSSSSTHLSLIHNFLRHPKPPSYVCLFLKPFCFSASISQSNHRNKPRFQSFSSPSTSLVAKSFSSIDEPVLGEDEESDEDDFSEEEYEDEEEEEGDEVDSEMVSEASEEEISEMGLGDKGEKTEKMKKKARGSGLKLSIKEKKELASYAHSLGDKLKCQLVGKSGVTDSVVFSFLETLEKNELLKVSPLQG